MHAKLLLAALLPALGAHGVRILQSNDDGWAEQSIRSLNDALNKAGYDVILSAPAENGSGTGSSDEEPTDVNGGCQYNTCPDQNTPFGANLTNPRLNWVNSFPVTSARFGVERTAPAIWNGAGPELVVSGPNVGHNLWLTLPFSGTVGVATYASKDAGIPAIAFSGSSSVGARSFEEPDVPAQTQVYTELAQYLVDTVVGTGAPYLPADVFLNVNFPKVDDNCASAADFDWILTRVTSGIVSAPDVEHCGSTRLPSETVVALGSGCHIAVSVGDSNDKTTASADKQAEVLAKLGPIFSCL
ncbi:survival protein sure-like phosphatase/nucleotidase [Camillea tinctor]|nr:survival protein sure-like phosphatase/nucleotidase [Camillea tinctor]